MAKQGTSKAAAAVRRAKFVEAYIANGGNATEAAREAGYPARSARSRGHELVKDRDVLDAIRKRQDELAKKLELTTEGVLRSLAQAVHFDPRKLYNEDGTLKSPTELDDDTAAALAGIEIIERRNDDESAVVTKTKIRWLDKNGAREQAMKHLGLYEKDNRQITDPIRDLLAVIASRAKFAPKRQDGTS